jgi:hypothetical protein
VKLRKHLSLRDLHQHPETSRTPYTISKYFRNGYTPKKKWNVTGVPCTKYDLAPVYTNDDNKKIKLEGDFSFVCPSTEGRDEMSTFSSPIKYSDGSGNFTFSGDCKSSYAHPSPPLKKLNTGAIIGIVVGSSVVLILLIAFIVVLVKRRH